ncbi:HD domain-containing protein 2-like protein isoform X1 [Cinnamomum micranthum f. kanehirae]|uniref:HD domain-containing protein 2-like protein isoform X1 n=1 Tax=Cinnamomum micranthum f. kanehirae TaxID=337451 RepID=A0A3S3NTD9_9MAGN|nr:HD domain-containing protein 2-like protein isoform X1 [Cinnamomum micranthum f. kanehirae]
MNGSTLLSVSEISKTYIFVDAIVGDITPSDGVPKEEKSRREREALNEMCEVLGGGMRAEEIKELWAEYENNSSNEVEMILQALEYETEHGKVLDEFFLSTAGKFQTETGRAWAAEVISRRNLRLDDRLKAPADELIFQEKGLGCIKFKLA